MSDESWEKARAVEESKSKPVETEMSMEDLEIYRMYRDGFYLISRISAQYDGDWLRPICFHASKTPNRNDALADRQAV